MITREKKITDMNEAYINSSPKDLRNESTASLLEASFKLRCQFTRASTDFALVKDEMEQELTKIETRYQGKQNQYIQKKDQQIERIIKFYNKVEQIINNYDNLFQLLKIQNTILENALNGRIIRDEDFAKEFLNLKY
jgi:hypothetical protein